MLQAFWPFSVRVWVGLGVGSHTWKLVENLPPILELVENPHQNSSKTCPNCSENCSENSGPKPKLLENCQLLAKLLEKLLENSQTPRKQPNCSKTTARKVRRVSFRAVPVSHFYSLFPKLVEKLVKKLVEKTARKTPRYDKTYVPSNKKKMHQIKLKSL